MIEATHEFDGTSNSSPRWNRLLNTSWKVRCGSSRLTYSYQFDMGQYIPPDLWKAWKAPPGWRKSGFYLRANKNIDENRFMLIFPCVRLYANDDAPPFDPTVITATLKLMQRPYQ